MSQLLNSFININNLNLKFKSSLMYTQIQPNQQPKSSIQLKRQHMQNARATLQRQKIKKTIRFTNLSQLLIKKNLQESKFITQLPLDDVHKTLNQMLEQQDFAMLSCCLMQLQTRKKIEEEFKSIITGEFMHEFVQVSQDIINRPQIIGIYKCLSVQSTQFHEIMFEHPQTVRNITQQIQSMKSSPSQEIYLSVLEDISPSYSKHYQEDTNQLFTAIFQMLQNETINFLPGVSILKALSPFINQKIGLSSNTINRLLREYQEHIQKEDSQKIIQTIFLIVTKIIYYTKHTDIITNWRMINIVLHANKILKQKVIQGYYNFYLLLAKLIDKIANYEIQNMSSSHVKDLKCKLYGEYQVDYLDYQGKDGYQVTTILVSHLLTHTRLLQLKEYNTSYLYFFVIVTKYCKQQVLVKHFVDSYFLEFLADCIDHSTIEICGLALETFTILLQYNTGDYSQTLQRIKDYCNLKPILENKLYKTDNPTIVRDITCILDKFDKFDSIK